jgi:hypothetical protein
VAAYDAQTGYSGSGTTPPAPTAALLVPTYLQSFPSSSRYTIGLNDTGAVTVAAPPSATPVPFDTNDTCGNLGNSTLASTTTVPANGVTVMASIPYDSTNWGAQEELSLTNPSPITALSITVTVAQTGGLTETQQYDSFPTGSMTDTTSTSGSAITYTFVSKATIPAGNSYENIWAQFTDNGTAHVTSGDLWSVASTSGGVSSTLTGHF